MNKRTRYALLLASGLALGTAYPAAAQDQRKVYTYVEQMPALPGGGGQGAIQSAIQHNFRYPADALKSGASGRIFVSFVVLETGDVADVKVVKGLSTSLDAAAAAAVKGLPTFIPGKQNGQAVAVNFTIPLNILADGPPSNAVSTTTVKGNADAPDLSDLSGEGNKIIEQDTNDKVYTYVEQMPALPGGGGMAAIVNAVQKELVVPANAQEGRVFASFTVLTSGGVGDLKILKGLDTSTDAAVLAAIRKLPTFIPGKQNGRVVAVSFTIPVTIRLPNHVFEAHEVGTRARFAAPGLYPYLQHNLHVPAVVASEKLHGLVGVNFVVLPTGKVDKPVLTSHVCSSCDDEVLRLVSSMPAWVPARDQAGHAVAVRQHLEVPLPLPVASAPYTRPDKPYTYVAQAPTLLDGTPAKDLGPVLSQTIRYSETARREKINGTAQLEFIVDASGIARDARITHSVCSSCDQSVLDALAAAGPFVPGRQSDQAVPVLVQLEVPFSPPATAPTKPSPQK